MTDSILIDTNSAAILSLYVEACIRIGEDPGTSIDVIRDDFRAKNIDEHCINYVELKKGYRTHQYLKENTENIEVWFSIFSEIELLNLFLEKIFQRELLRSGVPYRIRDKKPFKTQINFDYEANVSDYWDCIRTKLSDDDIEFQKPEDTQQFTNIIPDIISICRIVTKYVALTPVDLYLYSTAIRIRCNKIYTYDGEFKSIINNLYKKNGNWKTINDKITGQLITSFSSFKEEAEGTGNFPLPEGCHA